MVNERNWRYWARRYATAALLTLGQLSVPIAGHLRSRPAVVRVFDHRRRSGFDAREMAAPDVVLTVPLTLDEHNEETAVKRRTFHWN